MSSRFKHPFAVGVISTLFVIGVLAASTPIWAPLLQSNMDAGGNSITNAASATFTNNIILRGVTIRSNIVAPTNVGTQGQYPTPVGGDYKWTNLPSSSGGTGIATNGGTGGNNIFTNALIYNPTNIFVNGMSGTNHSMGVGASPGTILWNVISGGMSNTLGAVSKGSLIAGGVSNIGGSFFSTIGGGFRNEVPAPSADAGNTVAGGIDNVIDDPAAASTISGGRSNNIDATDSAFLGGGDNNHIGVLVVGGSLVGGKNNSIAGTSHGDYSFIGGGQGNTIPHYLINGGGAAQDSSYSAIIYGQSNQVNGMWSCGAGWLTFVTNHGVFAWSDHSSTSLYFNSIISNSFIIRAQNGVGINTNNPGGASLTVNGQTYLNGYLRLGGKIVFDNTNTAPSSTTPVAWLIATNDTNGQVYKIGLCQ